MNLLEVKLEPLDKQNENHLRMMYEVRTHAEVAKHLCGTPPKTYEQHLNYLFNIASHKNFFIISANNHHCGYAQITVKDNEVELGWALHPDWWGKTIGTNAVRLLIEHVRKNYQGYLIFLIVKMNNFAAIHIYNKSGFIIKNSDNNKKEFRMELINA